MRLRISSFAAFLLKKVLYNQPKSDQNGLTLKTIQTEVLPFNSFFMAGEGHIADMITRMKNNQALKLQKKEHQKKLNELFRKEHRHSGDDPVADVKISEENLQKIKSGIKAKLNLESQSVFRNTLLISILVIAAIVAIVYWGFLK